MLSRKANFWLNNPDAAKGKVADPPAGFCFPGGVAQKLQNWA